MALSQMELQLVREMLSEETLAVQKLRTYAQQAGDPQVRSTLSQCAERHQRHAQELMNFLQ